MAMSSTQKTTLIDYVVPDSASRGKRLAKDVALVVVFSLLTVISALFSFRIETLGPVPITLQTLMVLLTGAALGSKRGGAAMLTYLAMGAVGLPVFAGGVGGFPFLFGVTAGYLWSFPVVAFVVGLLCERGLDRSYLTAALAMIPGTLINYTMGVTWLTIFLHVSVAKGLALGLYPFIIGDLIKLAFAAALLPSAWALVRWRDR